MAMHLGICGPAGPDLVASARSTSARPVVSMYWASSNATATAASVSTHPRGSINLFDNDLILDYTGTSQIANVQALFNGGRAADWVGTGIVSFSAANNSLNNTTLSAMDATGYRSIYGPGAMFNASGGAVLSTRRCFV